MKAKSKLPKTSRSRTKLNQHGILHHVVPLVFVVLFGVAGVGLYVMSHAATANPEIQSGISGLGNWCINDERNSSTAANNPVNTAICNGSAAQQWTYANGLIKDTALSTTRCIETENGGTAAATRIVIEPCSGSKAQQWTHNNNGSFQNMAASKAECLAVYGGQLGYQLRINTCNTTYHSQNWAMTIYKASPHVVGVIKGSDGKCVTDADDSTAAYNKLEVETCNGHRSQQWYAVKQNTQVGAAQVFELNGQWDCITPKSYTVDSAVVLEACGGSDRSVFSNAGSFISDNGMLEYADGRNDCISASGGNMTDGTSFELLSCANQASQKWKFVAS